MKSKHTFKRRYTHMEQLLIADEIKGLYLDDRYTLDVEFIQWRHANIGYHSLFVGIHHGGEAVFYVNGSSEFQSPSMTPQTGAIIWRWLMEAWRDIMQSQGPRTLSNYVDFVYCYVEKSDGLLERRKRMFSKLGFIQNGDHADYLRLTVPPHGR
jgi:hypothetical protein